MSTIATKDGTQIYFKDWGTGQPVVTTARNGRCARPNAGFFAVNRWNITTVKSD